MKSTDEQADTAFIAHLHASGTAHLPGVRAALDAVLADYEQTFELSEDEESALAAMESHISTPMDDKWVARALRRAQRVLAPKRPNSPECRHTPICAVACVSDARALHAESVNAGLAKENDQLCVRLASLESELATCKEALARETVRADEAETEYSEFWRKAGVAWQTWADETLAIAGIAQPPMGKWGHDKLREKLGLFVRLAKAVEERCITLDEQTLALQEKWTIESDFSEDTHPLEQAFERLQAAAIRATPLPGPFVLSAEEEAELKDTLAGVGGSVFLGAALARAVRTLRPELHLTNREHEAFTALFAYPEEVGAMEDDIEIAKNAIARAVRTPAPEDSTTCDCCARGDVPTLVLCDECQQEEPKKLRAQVEELAAAAVDAYTAGKSDAWRQFRSAADCHGVTDEDTGETLWISLAPPVEPLSEDDRAMVEHWRTCDAITSSSALAIVDRLAPPPKPKRKTAQELGEEIHRLIGAGKPWGAVLQELIHRACRAEAGEP